MYALVTGASSGIGREIARLLAAKGYNLILTARRESLLASFGAKIEKHYAVRTVILPADLSKEQECLRLFSACKPYPVSIVINAAGFGKLGTCQDVPLEDELAIISTNLRAVHILTKLFANHMKKGRILNISSIAAFQPGPYFAAYSASKSYVLQLSMAWNYEMIRRGKKVRILTLCPGPVDTDFNRVAGTDFAMPSISAKKCAKAAVTGLFANKALILPGFFNKCAYIISKYAPNCCMLPVEYYIQTSKKGH